MEYCLKALSNTIYQICDSDELVYSLHVVIQASQESNTARVHTCLPAWAGGYIAASSLSHLSFSYEYHSHNLCMPRGVKTQVVYSALFLDSQVNNTMTSLQGSGVGSLPLCMFFQVLDSPKEFQPTKN